MIAKLLMLWALIAFPASAQLGFTWTHQTINGSYPGGNGYHRFRHDPVSGQFVLYQASPGSTTIYSSDIYFYNPSSNTFTHLGGNGSANNTASCATTSTGSWPGDRHPIGNFAIDLARNLMWLSGGVCGGSLRVDTYYLTLNASPASDAWTKVSTTAPTGNVTLYGQMTYDSTHDQLIMIGPDGGANTHNVWRYCPTVPVGGGSPTGSLSSPQTTGGCANADQWDEILLSTMTCTGAACQYPSGGSSHGIPAGMNGAGTAWDTTSNRMYYYGGKSGSSATNDIFKFDPETGTWTQLCSGGCSPPPAIHDTGSEYSWVEMGFDHVASKWYHHQSSSTGSPQDWVYDVAGDTWTLLTSSGSGPTNWNAMAMDETNHILMTWSENTSKDVWLGYFPTAPTITSSSLAAGATGSAYSQSVATTGLPVPSCAITSGSFPGVSFTAGTCTLAGTPTFVGSNTFSVTATNIAGSSSPVGFTVTITAGGGAVGLFPLPSPVK